MGARGTRLLAATAAFALGQGALQAQDLLHLLQGGGAAGNGLGQTLRPAGDVNGDGHGDLIVGYRMGSGSQAGTARVFSGKDGSVLHTFTGAAANDQLGWAVDGAGDVNGDGFDDVILGVRGDDANGFDSGAAQVRSGLDGSLLLVLRGESQRLRLGWSVCGAGDLDGDGFADVAVGAAPDTVSAHPAGFFRAYSGADGSVLFEVSGATSASRLGWSLRSAGDVDGDGVPDLVVGDWRDGANGADSGAVHVRSGVDGSLIWIARGDKAGDQLGYDVSGVGDLDGDGRADFAAGAPLHDGAVANTGLVRVYSGASGAVLLELAGDGSNDLFGSVLAGCGDVDGDGTPDVLVGAPNDDDGGIDSGSARVWSGADGSLLWRVDGGAADRLGTGVCGAGDADADGGLDWAVGAPLDNAGAGFQAGSVRVYRGIPPPEPQGPQLYCVSSPNAAGAGALIDWSGSASVSADDLVLHVSGLPRRQLAMFVFGAEQAALPFGGGVLCIQPPLHRLPPLHVSDRAGTLSHALGLSSGRGRLDLIQPGTTWCFQLVYRDPVRRCWGRLNTSDALQVPFVP